MLHVICDICKKHIPGAMTSYSWDKREVNYRVYLDKAICYSCADQLDQAIRDDMADKSEYALLERNKVFKGTLERLTE